MGDGLAKISQRESRDVGDGPDAAVEQAHSQRSEFLGQAWTSRELQHLRFVDLQWFAMSLIAYGSAMARSFQFISG